jgi:hypothetical protein
MASRLLGLSHTAVNKWVKTGDLPVVISERGRKEIPISALVDVYESVSRERERGHRRQHTLEPLMTRQRRRAAQLDPKQLVSLESPDERAGHRRAELRSLAYHRTLARRLRRVDVRDAQNLLWQWMRAGRIDPRYAEEWEKVLSQPLGEIRDIISADTQHARDLRQNSPFAGLLSEPERRRIREEIR